MSQYDNTNTGTLFKNDKGDNEKRPDLKGSININGQEYWLSAWVRTAGENSKRAGEKFYSLKAELKDQQPQAQAAVRQAPATVANLDDDLPF